MPWQSGHHAPRKLIQSLQRHTADFCPYTLQFGCYTYPSANICRSCGPRDAPCQAKRPRNGQAQLRLMSEPYKQKSRALAENGGWCTHLSRLCMNLLQTYSRCMAVKGHGSTPLQRLWIWCVVDLWVELQFSLMKCADRVNRHASPMLNTVPGLKRSK